MPALRWGSVLLVALAVVAGAALWLQRQSAAQLRDELALLRDERRRLVQLQAENARLAAAEPSAAQLAVMSADHAAVFRLRGEIEKLAAETEQQARAVERPEPPMVLASDWKNAGRATPAAAVETIFWSEARHDTDGLASLLTFDPALRAQATAFFDALPEDTRAQYRTVERLVANFMTKDTSAVTMRIIDEKQVDADHAQLGVQVQNQVGGRNWVVPLTMERGADGWRLAVAPGLVRDAANALGIHPWGSR